MDETIWATQIAMAELFDVNVKTINEHLTNVFAEGELIQERTIRKIRMVASYSNSFWHCRIQ